MKAIIIGLHPIVQNLTRQYKEKGFDVDYQQPFPPVLQRLNDYDEMVLIANAGEDEKVIALLAAYSQHYHTEHHGGRRMRCHLMVQSRRTLQMLYSCELCDAIKKKFDVYPFTLDDEWCKSIVLDWEPINIQSEKHVHLVIFGDGEVAESMAIHAVHVAHYPNYIHNHSLRTRITMVTSEAESKYEDFIKRHINLFDNCYYRVVKPSDKNAVKMLHRPMYEGKREDFVDVEWEFVEADCQDALLRRKLQLWAEDCRQVLTLVFAHKEEDKNICQAILLPDAIFARRIPVYIYSHVERVLPSVSSFHLFGLSDRGYDLNLPIVEMAKSVKYVYEQCYNYIESVDRKEGRELFPISIDKEECEGLWREESSIKRQSCIRNAMSIPTKLRSIGLEENDWEKFYDLTREDIEILAEVEHNRWNVEELILGYRPCTDKELRDIERDVAREKGKHKSRMIHYDLCAYNELRTDHTGKSVKVYDLTLSYSLPLIVKSLCEERGASGYE